MLLLPAQSHVSTQGRRTRRNHAPPLDIEQLLELLEQSQISSMLDELVDPATNEHQSHAWPSFTKRRNSPRLFCPQATPQPPHLLNTQLRLLHSHTPRTPDPNRPPHRILPPTPRPATLPPTPKHSTTGRRPRMSRPLDLDLRTKRGGRLGLANERPKARFLLGCERRVEVEGSTA